MSSTSTAARRTSRRVRQPVLRRVLIAVLAVLALSPLAACAAGGATALGTQDFLAKTQEPAVVVLDVRTAGEYAAGHLDGAVNVDAEAPTFDSQISSLDKAATYAVYCHSGRRAGIAAEAMTKAGFTNVFRLDNAGFAELAAAGAPVATG